MIGCSKGKSTQDQSGSGDQSVKPGKRPCEANPEILRSSPELRTFSVLPYVAAKLLPDYCSVFYK